MTDAGLALLSELEGREAEVYLDTGGEPTIGVGHLLTRGERMSGKILIADRWVRYRDGLTEPQIDALLRQDLGRFEDELSRSVTVPLCDHQADALLCFMFNVGRTAFRNSTLLRRLLSRRYEDVPGQLRRWVYDNGKKVRGLQNRREKEIARWTA